MKGVQHALRMEIVCGAATVACLVKVTAGAVGALSSTMWRHPLAHVKRQRAVKSACTTHAHRASRTPTVDGVLARKNACWGRITRLSLRIVRQAGQQAPTPNATRNKESGWLDSSLLL